MMTVITIRRIFRIAFNNDNDKENNINNHDNQNDNNMNNDKNKHKNNNNDNILLS